VGSRVISPEQQDDDGVFLLVQFEVIAWTEEKQKRRRTVVVAGWAGLILINGKDLQRFAVWPTSNGILIFTKNSKVPGVITGENLKEKFMMTYKKIACR
jgi:hypothetical protein